MGFKFNPITNKLDIVGDNNVSGDVTGPGSSTDRAIARWDGTTGTQLLDSSVIVTDAGIVQASGLELTTPLNEIYGGTGQIGYSTGDLLYADSATTLTTLPVSTDGKVLQLSGGLPSWQTPAPGGVTSVSGTADRITSSGGTTPVIDIAATYIGQTSITTLGTIATGTWNASVIALAYGGTNANLTASNGGIFYSTAAAGAILSGTATANKVLMSGATAAPSWSTPTYPNASVTAGKVIISDGTNYIASTPTFPNASATSGKFIRSDGTNWIASTPTLPTSAGTAGKVLMSDATNYVESNPTYPSTSGTARKILVSDGTNNVYSTETWAVPGTSGNVLTSDGTNWTSAAPAAGGMTWTEVVGASQAATTGNGYICNNAGLVSVTLPGTAAVGGLVAIQGKGAGGWNLTANTGQTIKYGNQTTSSAGSLASTAQYDAVEVVCITANTTWAVRGISQGNLTVA